MEAVKQLVAEKDDLQIKLKYASATIDEQQRIINHYNSLLSGAHSRLSQFVGPANPETAVPRPSKQHTSLNKSEWINVTWLSLPTNKALLESTEEAYRRGARQEALNSISSVLARKDLRPVERVNAKLLLSEILRSTGNLTTSLYQAEQALQIAKELEDYRLTSRSHFHRGLCFLHLHRYADASWSFACAWHVEDYTEQAELHFNISEKARKAVHPADPQRAISDSFD